MMCVPPQDHGLQRVLTLLLGWFRCCQYHRDIPCVGHLRLQAYHPSHWGQGVLETGDYIESTFRSLAHCTQNVLDNNIWSIITDERIAVSSVIILQMLL